MKGFIKLNRAIAQSDIWLEEPFSRGQAWVDLILSASYKPSSFRVRGNKVRLERGQTGMSQLTMAKRWKWSRGKVRRFLKDLEDEQMIVQQTGQVTSIVTICNYSKYQDASTTDETTDGTTDGQQTEQQTVHIQEVKEVKEELIGGKPPTRKFTPPEVQEVCQYMAENGLPEITARAEANKFVNFYGSKEWMVGKNKMKVWRNAAANWIQRRKEDESRDRRSPSAVELATNSNW